jgi:hypothetical protein
MPIPQNPMQGAGNNSAEKNGIAKHPRPSVPDEAAQKEALIRVRSVYATRYKAATTDTQRVALTRFLLGVSASTNDDPAARYVLLRESTRLAARTGDWALAMRIIDVSARWFDVDTLVVKADLFHKNGSSAPAGQLHTIRSYTDHLFAVAIAQDRFDVARRLAQTSLTASRRDRDRSVTRAAEKRITVDLPEFKARYEASQAAERTLARAADDGATDDGAAHAQLGKYLCYNRRDWSEGLPHLARSDDVPLVKAAQLDQNIDRSADPNDQKRTADAWFALAEDRFRTEQKALLARASFWYRAALPRLAGLSRDDAEHKLVQIKEMLSPGRTSNTRHSKGELDLLSQIKLSSHVIAGQWRRQGSTLFAANTGRGTMPRVAVPFEPQGSYQLDVAFTSPFDERRTIEIWLPVGSTGALLSIHSTYSGLFRIDNQPMHRNPATIRYANKLSPAPHKLSIRVLIKGDRVRILTSLDGKPFVRWQGPIDSLTDPAPWQFPNQRAFALGSDAGGVTYHRCTYRPAD